MSLQPVKAACRTAEARQGAAPARRGAQETRPALPHPAEAGAQVEIAQAPAKVEAQAEIAQAEVQAEIAQAPAQAEVQAEIAQAPRVAVLARAERTLHPAELPGPANPALTAGMLGRAEKSRRRYRGSSLPVIRSFTDETTPTPSSFVEPTLTFTKSRAARPGVVGESPST